MKPADRKADLQERIQDNQRKIEALSAFLDDPKIDKIVRVLKKQIAQDSYLLSILGEGESMEGQNELSEMGERG